VSLNSKRREMTPITLEMKNVASINPPPLPAVKWTGVVAAGGNLQRGNTDRGSGFITAEAHRRTEKGRMKFRYLFNSNPTPGFERTDVQYIGALQYSF
jgi:hypothetical protein